MIKKYQSLIDYYKDCFSMVDEFQEVEEAEKLNPVGPAFNADSALASTRPSPPSSVPASTRSTIRTEWID